MRNSSTVFGRSTIRQQKIDKDPTLEHNTDQQSSIILLSRKQQLNVQKRLSNNQANTRKRLSPKLQNLRSSTRLRSTISSISRNMDWLLVLVENLSYSF